RKQATTVREMMHRGRLLMMESFSTLMTTTVVRLSAMDGSGGACDDSNLTEHSEQLDHRMGVALAVSEQRGANLAAPLHGRFGGLQFSVCEGRELSFRDFQVVVAEGGDQARQHGFQRERAVKPRIVNVVANQWMQIHDALTYARERGRQILEALAQLAKPCRFERRVNDNRALAPEGTEELLCERSS